MIRPSLSNKVNKVKRGPVGRCCSSAKVALVRRETKAQRRDHKEKKGNIGYDQLP